MIAAQIHPEDLLDQAKHGGLRTEQERLLQTHLDTCAACRFELSLAPALYQNVELRSQDHALIARAIANVSRAPRYDRRSSLGQKTVSALTLLLSLLAGVAMASAGAYLWRRNNPPPMDAPLDEAVSDESAPGEAPTIEAPSGEAPSAEAPAPPAAPVR